MSFTPNTTTTIDGNRTNSSLSTQIIVKVGTQAVGALQSIDVKQSRQLKRINEIGTDGNIEIVPSASPTYELSVTRIIFDQLRLPEAFARGFRIIGAQRIPFDIDIYDIGNTAVGASGNDSAGLIITTFKGCWFSDYSTPYNTTDYTVVESATIWAETASVKGQDSNTFNVPSTSTRTINTQVDPGGIERAVNTGNLRGSLSVSGILNSLFATE